MVKILFVLVLSAFLISCGKQTWNTTVKKDPTPEEWIILALWDSLTAWYNLDISDSFPNQLENIITQEWYTYRVINWWVSWDTSENLLNRLALYDDLDIDIYLLWIWANDWLRRQSTDTLEKNIRSIITHIHSINPEGVIILEGMKIPLNLWLTYSQEFEKTYIDISQTESVLFFDFLLRDVARIWNLNLSDWIHPNKKWYAIIADNIFTFLQDNSLITK
jgi:acyl-CoA thioesterase-1